MNAAGGPTGSVPARVPGTDTSLLHFIDAVTDYAIYTLSPTGHVTSWNRGARRIKGYQADEILGEHFSRFYTAEDQAAGLPAHALHEAGRNGSYAIEGWRVRKDGSRFWAGVVIDPVHADDGRLIGYAKITRDLTERREAAAALEHAQLALFQAQKLEALGQLTSVMAHDFNNLLAVMLNGIAVLEREAVSPTGQRMLEAMRGAGTRGAALIDQLLAFARQRPMAPEPTDVNRLIVNFEPVLQRACPAAVRLSLQLQPDLPNLLLDTAQFEAALLNLLTNARDAMPGGGCITLVTGLTGVDDPRLPRRLSGRHVGVTVSDEGVGMTAEVRSRAIDPLFSTKPPGQGTGLGLSQVYGLSQQLGGDLAVESQPGAGTAVTIWIPVPDPDAVAGAALPRRRGKALVVDDSPEVVAVAAELFRSLGYEVLMAADGEAALAIVNATPDLQILFSDVVMPRLDGIGLAREARRLRPGLDIILASGFPNVAIDRELQRYKFIQKPYRLADIVRRLRET